MRRIAFIVVTLFASVMLSASLTVSSAPVDIAVEDDEAIVNIDVCNAAKQLLGGWVPTIPPPYSAFVLARERPESPSITIKYDSFSPVMEDPPPRRG